MNVINKHIFLRDRQDIRGRLERWQEVVDQISESYGGAASLICQLTETGIRPVVSSDQESNPFPAGTIFPLEDQTFCKEVISGKEAIYVGDAGADVNWLSSPVWAGMGFSSYYGLPVRWPDGEIFGTICVMDRAPTDYQTPFKAWMACFRDLIQADLATTDEQPDSRRYIADVSSDLKNSATTIVGRTESLMSSSSSLSEAQRLDLGSIQASAETLVTLLNDVMENIKTASPRSGAGDGSAGVSNRRVLVVEDNHINQKVAGALLQSLDYEFEFADDGAIALEAVQSTEFGIILMDVQMPNMDGLEATRRIRAMGGWQASVPIIAVTANAMTNDKYKCIDAGMNDLLPKPIDPARFMEVLQSYSGQ